MLADLPSALMVMLFSDRTWISIPFFIAPRVVVEP